MHGVENLVRRKHGEENVRDRQHCEGIIMLESGARVASGTQEKIILHREFFISETWQYRSIWKEFLLHSSPLPRLQGGLQDIFLSSF